MENKGQWQMCVYLPAIWPWDQSKVVCRAYCTCCIWIIQHARPSILTNITAGKNMYRLLRIHVQENRCSKQSLEILRILLNMYNLFSLPLSLSLHLHGYHTSISLQIVWQPKWIHNQSLTLIFLTLQQGLKGTEVIWITSILTVLPYSKAENAQAK